MRLMAGLWLVSWLVACGGDNMVLPGADAGIRGDAEAPDGGAGRRIEVEPPAAPAPPAFDGQPADAPQLTPCPAGWREVSADAPGDAYCEPWGEERASCSGAQAWLVGQEECARLGPSCPAGNYAEGLPTDGSVLFVRAGASGGDGSRSSPFGTIPDALAASEPGSTLALAAGRYATDFDIVPPHDVTLVGKCVAETQVAGQLFVSQATVTARNLRFNPGTPGLTPISVNGAEAQLTIEDTLVADSMRLAALVTDGARLTARRLVIRNVAEAPAGEMVAATGLGVQHGSDATLEQVVVEGVTGVGVFVLDSTVSASDLAVRDIAGDPREFGGLLVYGASVVDGQRLVVERSTGLGVLANGTGAQLNLGRALVRSTGTGGGVDLAFGLASGNEADVTVTESAFVSNEHAGLLVENGVFRGEDLLSRDTKALPSQQGSGTGVSAFAGAELTLDRVASVENELNGFHLAGSVTASHLIAFGNADLGVAVVGEDAIAEVEGLFAAGNEAASLSNMAFGAAFAIGNGATVRLKDALLEDNQGIALGLLGSGSSLDVTDLRIDGVRSLSDGRFGRGVHVGRGASVQGARLDIRGTEGRGVAAIDEGTSFQLEDLRIVRSGLPALQLQEPATGTVRRARITEAGASAVLVVGENTSLTLEDARLEASRLVLGFPMAWGINAFFGAELILRRALVEEMTGVAMIVSEEGSRAHIEDLEVRDSESVADTGNFGMGLTVQFGAEATVRGARFSGQRERGINVIQDARLEAEHVSVEATAPPSCSPECDRVDGTSLGVFRDSEANVRDFVFRDSGVCGIHLAEGSALDLQEGIVSENEIGACVQVDGYDLDRLTDGVEYIDNDRNLDSVTLPVPDPVALGPLGATGG